LDSASDVPSPEVSTVEEDSDGFKTVTCRKRMTVSAPAVITVIHQGQPLIAVRNFASYQLFQRRKGSRLLSFLDLVLKSLLTMLGGLKEQLSLKKLVCTGLKTKFKTYASVHVSVIE
jgi:hypothetical protein